MQPPKSQHEESSTERSIKERSFPKVAAAPSFQPINSKRSSRMFTSMALDFDRMAMVTRTCSTPIFPTDNTNLVDAEESLPKDIKSECFQWGKGAKILEKPKVLRGKHIKMIRSGGSHTLALLADGSVYCWGEGRCGQLGLGSTNMKAPQAQKIDIKEQITNIWAGFTQSAFVSKSGSLYLCGLIGQLLRFEPVAIPAFDNVLVKDVAFGPSCVAVLGSSFITGIGNEGKIFSTPAVWVWGHSRQGHLGLGERNSVEQPCELEQLNHKGVVQISGGEFHMAALTEASEVYVWGTLEASGTGEENSILRVPTPVLGLEAKQVIRVICGSSCTFALTKIGTIYSWGSGRYGILGHGDKQVYEYPSIITALKDKVMVGIATGGVHTCSWSATGCVYSWGSGRYFALGHETGEDLYTPRLVEALANGKIILDLTCGSDETFALVERDFIEITFKNQTSRLPVHSYPFVGHVIRKMAKHHKKRVEDLFLLANNQQLAVETPIREITFTGTRALTLLSKPSLYDYASAELVFLSPNEEQIIQGCDATPHVKGGSINKLVEWLTFPKPTGHEFASTFLLSYRTFITSDSLIEELICRFDHPTVQEDAIQHMGLPGFTEGQSKESSEQIIKLRVLNTIKRWLTNHSDNFIGSDTTKVAQKIQTFLSRSTSSLSNDISLIQREGSGIIRLVEDLAVKKKENFQIEQFHIQDCPEPSIPLHNGKWDIFKYSPVEIARQMTLIDYNLFFRKIQPGELIGQAWSKKNKEVRAPNVLNMIYRFNSVSEWVAKLILTGRTQSCRTANAERFIDIAHELFLLNSFNCVMSILSAFNSSSLHRLKSVWESKHGGISTGSQEKLNKLQIALSLEKNMVCYRDMFDLVPPPKIPFLGKYLQDLTFIDDGNPDYLDDEEKIVNFDKRMKLASIISVIQRLQKEPYAFISVAECVDGLLTVCGFGENQEANAYKISKFIEDKVGLITNDISDFDDATIRSIIEDSPVPAASSSRKRNPTLSSLSFSSRELFPNK